MNVVVLDRDGVINYDSDAYIKSPDEWTPILGSLEAIARLYQAGYRLVVCTNQSGVGRGLLDVETLNRIHIKMIEAVRHRGGEIEGVFFCPHAPDDDCRCRKPMPGLLEEAAERLKLSLSTVFVVGDQVRDVLAARAAGALPVLVRTGGGAKAESDPQAAGIPVFDDLAAFADALLAGMLRP